MKAQKTRRVSRHLIKHEAGRGYRSLSHVTGLTPEDCLLEAELAAEKAQETYRRGRTTLNTYYVYVVRNHFIFLARKRGPEVPLEEQWEEPSWDGDFDTVEFLIDMQKIRERLPFRAQPILDACLECPSELTQHMRNDIISDTALGKYLGKERHSVSRAVQEVREVLTGYYAEEEKV